MSREKKPTIFLNAEFRSYDEYQNAFDVYCQDNAINGVPLSFFRQTSRRLKKNFFKDESLDQDVINRFVYANLAMVCKFHKTVGGNNGLNCAGRITVRYIRSKNVLQVTTFIGEHTNHVAVTLPHEQQQSKNTRLNNIFELIKQLPDDAFELVEQTCQRIHEQWGDENSGLSIVITPILNDEADDEIPETQNDILPANVCQPQLLDTDSVTAELMDVSHMLVGQSSRANNEIAMVKTEPIDDNDTTNLQPEIKIKEEKLSQEIENIDENQNISQTTTIKVEGLPREIEDVDENQNISQGDNSLLVPMAYEYEHDEPELIPRVDIEPVVKYEVVDTVTTMPMLTEPPERNDSKATDVTNLTSNSIKDEVNKTTNEPKKDKFKRFRLKPYKQLWQQVEMESQAVESRSTLKRTNENQISKDEQIVRKVTIGTHQAVRKRMKLHKNRSNSTRRLLQKFWKQLRDEYVFEDEKMPSYKLKKKQ